MARASGSKPVEIVYYPKKARGPVPKRTQTVETLVTEEIEMHERRPSKKGRKTLTDETLDPTERAFSDLTRLGHEAFEAGRVDEAKVIFESVVALGRRHTARARWAAGDRRRRGRPDRGPRLQ